MILRIGSDGNAVFELQKMLAAKGFSPGVADGKFGDNTKKAVIAFQKANRLNADGIVGEVTYKALFGKSMPLPTIPSVIYQRDLMKLFGDPHESSFETTWLTTTQVDLVLKRPMIYCHKLMVEPLQQAVAKLRERKLTDEWHTYDGCFCVRYMRGGSSLSVHSWGLAIDINAAENPFGADDFQMTEEFANCFKEVGFTWGGDWSYPDAMHYQLAKVN